jgi:hypothetical protein
MEAEANKLPKEKGKIREVVYCGTTRVVQGTYNDTKME